MAANLKVGSIVQLSGGGPIMTVVFVPKAGDADPMCQTVWFNGGVEAKGRYPAEALDVRTKPA